MDLDGFEDLVEIGRGGFGVVYRARQATLGREVAVKVLSTATLSDDERRRFEREGVAMGRLSWHPNIVVVHQTGLTDDGRPYLVMEYLEGGSLGDRLRATGPLPVPEVLDHAIRLAGAIQTAHDAELLHRDIKADNALLDAFGRVKLGDFGIASVHGHTVTATGVLSGTMAHTAPEVLQGGRASPASDVYSLGSTLYELLSGAPAFSRPTDESIAAVILRATGEPAADLRPLGVPDPVATVLEATMAKAPEDRPDGAAGLGVALQGAQQALGLPVTDLPVRRTTAGPGPVAPTSPTAVAGAAAPSDPVEGRPEAATVAIPRPSGPDRAGSTPPAPSPPAPVGDPEPAARPTQAGGGARRWPLLVLAVVATATLGWFAVGALSGDDGPPDDRQPAEDQADDDPTRATSVETVDVPVGDLPQGVTADDGGVWVSVGGDDLIARIDPATDTVAETIGVGDGPEGIAAGEGSLWVANRESGSVSRVEPATGAVTDIPVGSLPRGVAVTPGAVWVTNRDDDTVSRIDPATDTVVATLPVGDDPIAVAADETAVWVTNFGDDTVSRIDPRTGDTTDVIEVAAGPRDVAVTPSGVWVTHRTDDTLTRIDPTDDMTARTMSIGSSAWAVAGHDGEVWVTDREDGTVVRIDPATDTVAERLVVGDKPGTLTVTDEGLWVAYRELGLVRHVTPS